jgi:hypothetical protein
MLEEHMRQVEERRSAVDHQRNLAESLQAVRARPEREKESGKRGG